MAAIRTAFLDNQEMFVEGLCTLFQRSKYPQIKVTGRYDSFQDFLEANPSQLDLIFMELDLNCENGTTMIPELKKLSKDLRIVVLTNYGESRLVKECLKNGADGYILKTANYLELIECVEDVIKGNRYIGQGLRISPAPRDIENKKKEKVKPGIYQDRFLVRQKLTKREQEILKLISQAKSNKEIAAELFISDQTVSVHKKNIMKKLGIRSTVNLIRYVLDNQIV
jgi:DNA-binding NarL/FixJ family response regulator